MPIYEYMPKNDRKCCKFCADGFEIMQKVSDDPLTECPECGVTVKKLISSHSVGSSKSGFYSRARNAGFTTMKKTTDGGYEKMK